jgi:tail tube protein
MEPIHGKDALLSIKVGVDYLPALCATDFSYRVAQDVVLATAPGSGFWRQRRRRGISEWTVDLSGITKIDNTDGQASWFYMVQESVRGTIVEIQLLYEDTLGNSVTIEGSAIIPDMILTASVQGFVEGTINFQGTGEPTMSTTPPVPESGVCAVQESIVLTLAEGATSVTSALLTTDNAQVLWVTRSGFGLIPIPSGTPLNDQFVVNYATGAVTFATDNPGNAGGEPVVIGWHITG